MNSQWGRRCGAAACLAVIVPLDPTCEAGAVDWQVGGSRGKKEHAI